ncbi:phage virion morphogenesis protein [Ferrimonas sp.]|uniref:phage virion morphogenesis protein n=1 Tax=Ferrimonas sp. TaxID=2080861 RepID=UPI003A8EB465
MAGAHIEIKLEGLEQLQAQLQQLAAKGEELTPALEDIGELLLLSHQERWAQGVAPDGTPWAPLSDTTQKMKPKHQTTPLRLNDILRDTLSYQVANGELLFGSAMAYAAMQHFGGTTSPKSMIPGKDIPARPFLGTSDEDEQEILQILQDHLQSAQKP